jgi:hypothetical protein
MPDAFKTRLPTVGIVGIGHVSKQPIIFLRVPIISEGVVGYGIYFVKAPSRTTWARLLAQQLHH